MGTMKKTYDGHFKAKVALEAIKGEERSLMLITKNMKTQESKRKHYEISLFTEKKRLIH